MFNRIRIRLSAALAVAMVALPAAAAAHDIDPDSRSDNYANVWARIDADRVAAQAWVGGTPTVGPVNLAMNLVFTQNYPDAVDPFQNIAFNLAQGDDYRAPSLRLELGPALATGGFFFLPKVGLGYDFEREKVAPFVPQLMMIIEGGPLYVETWFQFFFYSPFDEGSQDTFYTRDMLLVALNNHWAVGLQTEIVVALKNEPNDTLRSLPVGAALNVSPIEALTLGAFLGYETQDGARNSEDDFVAGRLTISVLF